MKSLKAYTRFGAEKGGSCTGRRARRQWACVNAGEARLPRNVAGSVTHAGSGADADACGACLDALEIEVKKEPGIVNYWRSATAAAANS